MLNLSGAASKVVATAITHNANAKTLYIFTTKSKNVSVTKMLVRVNSNTATALVRVFAASLFYTPLARVQGSPRRSAEGAGCPLIDVSMYHAIIII